LASRPGALRADPTNLTALHEIAKAAYETGNPAEGEQGLRAYPLCASGEVPILLSLSEPL